MPASSKRRAISVGKGRIISGMHPAASTKRALPPRLPTTRGQASAAAPDPCEEHQILASLWSTFRIHHPQHHTERSTTRRSSSTHAQTPVWMSRLTCGRKGRQATVLVMISSVQIFPAGIAPQSRRGSRHCSKGCLLSTCVMWVPAVGSGARIRSAATAMVHPVMEDSDRQVGDLSTLALPLAPLRKTVRPNRSHITSHQLGIREMGLADPAPRAAHPLQHIKSGHSRPTLLVLPHLQAAH